MGAMTIALSLLFVAILTIFVLVAAIMPAKPKHSTFDRNRRRDAGEEIRLEDLRARRLADIHSLQRILIAILLVILLLVALELFGSVLGTLIVLLIAVTHGMPSRFVPVRHFAQKLYDEQELALLKFIDLHKGYFLPLRHADAYKEPMLHFESKPELSHLITNDRTVLPPPEKELLIGALNFESRTVGDLMIRRDKLFTIKKSEILGPLVLDDLYKSGHDSFPVVSGESEEIVGILRLREVQTLDTSRRHTARVESAMDSDIRTIQASQPASAALTLLIESQHHMLIVKDGDSVSGIVTFADIIKVLFGQKA